jgi:hypothetical protein
MYKNTLSLIFLLLINTSLSAMDLNETTTIIDEASKATKVLQDEFDILVNEVVTPIKEEVSKVTEVLHNEFDTLVNDVVIPIKEEISEFTPNILEVVNSIPLIEVFELNKSVEINSSILIQELNTSTQLSCKEENQSVIINGLSINLDANNSITDNGCTDANLGTSAEGLIIFKTRIRPYCDISGETFAKQYMQEDWDDIYHDKEFKMEILKACPKMEERYKNKWTPHLYQFTLEYASDSDAIPEC